MVGLQYTGGWLDLFKMPYTKDISAGLPQGRSIVSLDTDLYDSIRD
jgi:hypothetical protein